MLRETLSEEFSRIANVVMPEAVGDGWQSSHFTVLFPHYSLIEPVGWTDDGLWRAVAQIEGDMEVRIMTQEANTPLDILPLVLAFFVEPLDIKPKAKETQPGEIAVQAKFKAVGGKDLMYQGDTGIVPVLQAKLEYCYLLERLNFPTDFTASPDYTANFDQVANHYPHLS